ncbi:hypothetical protein BD324DRAFT_614131 [Kockovaella imperatae]|uniref:NmrA-like domain-containing protein n=1 Tax=Kockovaella imperatae TaxID=4999 RepID=A0A1Y1UND4_9TREE|nr:hypothetical protein BD324DRAFT_614131 [Kockovaella imperatae]ORX39553.1 hypothetical protein BD324DRAFT_614131 [Kockovaella imperatae]
MQRRRAALFGATSRIGPAIVSAFSEDTSADAWHLYLIIRPSSKAPKLPENSRNISVHTLPADESSTQELADVFEKLDCSVVISSLNAGLADLHKSIAEACVAAGVSRFIPADYGSIRSDDPWALDLMVNFRNKAFVRWRCQRLADQHPSFSWTSLATGHFFDYGLHTELLGYDLKKGTAQIFDGGDLPFSASTTAQIGRAVVKVLSHEKETANKMLLIQSFCVTQNEVAAEIERATGKPLQRIQVDGNTYLLENAAKAEKGDAAALEEAVAVCGILRSNWQGRPEYGNTLLELDEEDMREVVRKEIGST